MRILIADDHGLIREGLKNSLSEISIYDMALKTEQGEAFLKI